MIKRLTSLMISLAFLLTGSACAAAEESPEKSVTSLAVSSTLDESSPVESQAAALSAGGAFADVVSGDWFYTAVEYCREHGLMSGKSASRFAPKDNMTRAELATVLYRHAKSPAVTSSPDFIDVQTDTWYTKAVAWAQENKIVSGYGNGRFGTNDNVRREDIATIFWRYAGSPEVGRDAEFADMSQVSGYALEAVDWARANGIISGKGNNRFDPKGYTTRAEVATMLMNFSKYTPDVPPSPDPDSTKILVAYFSATGTTRPLAEYAAEHLGADIYEITPQEPYTEEDLAYYTDCRADREQNDPSARPAISGGVEDMGQYDVVFIGYPIWHGQAPRIVSTFLESYDFTGKTIVPFCTSHSSGIGSSATNLHELAGGAKWLDGKRFGAGTSREEIENWVDGLDLPTQTALPYDGIFPQHEPMGEGIGAMPGRVVWAHDPDSVEWDGSGYWWELSHFDEAAIQSMVDESIASLGGKTTPQEGWQALFAYKSGGGYRAGEKIAIKANINGSAVMDDDTSGETAMSYTNPVLLKTLLASLVKEAGISPADITVYDVSRLFPDYMVEMCTQGDLQGVNFVGRSNGVADESAPIIWSQEFSGRVNYLPTCVTEANYVINLANLKGHSYGITLCGKNHFGSFINGNAMRPPEGANLHQWLTRNELGIYSPLTDLMANADLGDKTVLYMLDALICAPSEGASITKENATWQQEPFDGGFTASVFVIQDPVAIDSVGADFLSNEPTVTQYNRAAASANNEKYKGAALLQKKFTIDFLDKKMKINEGEVPQYYIEQSHQPIIDPEEFDKVQAEFARRKGLGHRYSGNSIFASRIVCGDCGGFYGSKVWHSNSKYRRTIWQCNEKFSGERKCRTPHLREEDIKVRFLAAFNQLLNGKDALLEDCRVMQDHLTNCSALDAELDELLREIEVVTELTRRCIQENARNVQSQEEYTERYNGYVARYDAAKAKLDALQKEKAQADSIGGFMFELSEYNEAITEFDEGLWLAAIEKAMAYHDGRLVFTFQNGLKLDG